MEASDGISLSFDVGWGDRSAGVRTRLKKDW
jgi:hypothetical protein